MMSDQQKPESATPATPAAAPPETSAAATTRVMRVSPLDLRQPRFKPAVRGYDKTDVVAFLTEAADDYEHALREMDRLRLEVARLEALLVDHREREMTLRNTLITAQRLADDMKEAAQNEARMIVREAQGRSDLLIQKAQARLEQIERDITELRLRRRGVEGTLEAAIQTLYHGLEFIRAQDQQKEGEVHLHRPRQAADGTTG